jgi:hypothetical protein
MRLPERKRMTIALGLLARNGLVLAADTEETYGYFKLNRGKIGIVLSVTQDVPGELRYRQCAIAGSGDGHNIEAVSDKLRSCIYNGEDKSDAEIEAELSTILVDFHAAHVLPFATYPQPERPEFQLLIGAQLPNRRLYLFEHNTLRDAGIHAAIGVGAYVAQPYLIRFHHLPMLDVEGTILLASYIMYHAKDLVVECGKATDIVGLRGQTFFQFSRKETAAMENAIGEYSRDSEPNLIRQIGGMDDKEGMRAAAKGRTRLKAVMASITAKLKQLPPEPPIGPRVR